MNPADLWWAYPAAVAIAALIETARWARKRYGRRT